ncbi:MAG: hypothetical protein Q8936_16655 [Bacillota bacterium]|nr:hypothetical protein [Bacillota bacterium]
MYTITVELPENYEILTARAFGTVLAKELSTTELEYLIKKLEESEEE